MITESEQLAIAADIVQKYKSYDINGSIFLRMMDLYDLTVHRRRVENQREIDNAKLRIP